MNFQAAESEFRYRFWFIGAIFWAGFSPYSAHDENISVALARLIVGRVRDDSPLLDHSVRAFFVLGTLIAALAALIRTWAGAYLHSSIIHDNVLHADRLVADGPFRHLRNPLYLGTILLAVAIGTMASRIGFVILCVGMILFSHRLILREEARLLQSQGENYRRYCNAVPRLVPSIRARVPPGHAKPDWKDGFIGEAFIWGFVPALAVFAVTERLRYFWLFAGAGFAIYIFQNFLPGHKRSLPG